MIKKTNKFETVYLDTNVLFGYGKELARKYKDEKYITEKSQIKKYKTEIKTDNLLDKLRKAKFQFITSRLTNYEFIKKLKEEEGISLTLCMEILDQIIDKYRIVFCGRKDIKLSDSFINAILKYEIDIIDGIHIKYAIKPHTKTSLKFTIVTMDKKMLENGKKIYELIKTPKELLNSK